MPSQIENANQVVNRGDILPLGGPYSYNLESSLEQVAEAIDQQDLPKALHFADRARRIAPKSSACILLYAQLLIKSGFANDALCHLTDKSDPNIYLALGTALYDLGFLERAAQCCADLLRCYSVEAIVGLSAFAERLSRGQGSTPCLGWVGVNDRLELVGEVVRSGRLKIECPEGHSYPVSRGGGRGTQDSFTCILPLGVAGKVSVRVDNHEVIGSGMLWPPEFKPLAWVTLEGMNLMGEVHFGWSPKLPVMLKVSASGGLAERTLLATPDSRSQSCTFSCLLSDAEICASSLDVAVVLPDGSMKPVVGSPIVPGARQELMTRKRKYDRAAFSSSALSFRSGIQTRIVDIIVPVYKAKDETLACLKSIFRTADREATEIVVVNDASPDPELIAALQDLAADARISLISNPKNLGFPGAANRGMQLHPDRDVILLNSDTEVFGDWIARLKRSATASPDIGTVTPLGESGSITDYPRGDSRESVQAEEIDLVASEVNAGKLIDLPVAVGFCMYIKRRCLDETGELDAATFGRGYGEENDFCLRARNLGWRHVVATDVFVAHHGGRSFGEMTALLKKRNSRILQSLHPEYNRLIEDFSASDPLAESRRAIDTRRLVDSASNPVLLITHDRYGGVKRHIDERQAALSTAGHTVLILQPSTPRGDAPKVTIKVHSLGLENLVFDVSSDLIQLEQLFRDLCLSHIEIHHLLGLPVRIIGVATRLGVPYDLYLHDYSWICPRVALIDGSGRYCGEPALADCELCVQKHGSEMEDSLTVAQLRKRSAGLLLNARRAIVPSNDARERFARYFPTREFEITPWESIVGIAMEPPTSAGRARVAVIGGIGIPKGYQILLDCARDAAARKLDIEFCVIGYTVDDKSLLDTGRVFVTGPYQDDEVGMLLEREQCNVVLLPSVSPETWCYSLTHAITRNLPIVAFSLGAQAERLRGHSSAKLLSSSSNAQQINFALLRSVRGLASGREIEEGSMDQEKICGQHQPSEIRSEDLASSVQVVKLPQGIYSCTVKEGGAPRRLDETFALPAMQVGIAPVTSSGKIEILSGASNLDRWLAYKDDMIVVRIAEGGAALLLTSVRMKDSPTLAVGIERLNAQIASDESRIESGAAELPARLEVRLFAHIRYVGDLSCDGGRIGWPGKQMWIEGFAISSIAGLPPDCVEYRGVISTGIPTPWLQCQALCGSKGGGLPLVGFAVRLKPEYAERYECDYIGVFSSGANVGPMQDGVLCSSDMANDPLEAIEIRVVERKTHETSVGNLGVTAVAEVQTER